MTEEPFALFGFGFWLILLIVAFHLLNRYQQKRPPRAVITILLHTICVVSSLLFNMGLTWVLYGPAFELFGINTNGFINLNGIFAAGIIWSTVCLLSWLVMGKAKEQVGSYYRTLRISLMVFALLPLFCCLLFLFLASLK